MDWKRASLADTLFPVAVAVVAAVDDNADSTVSDPLLSDWQAVDSFSAAPPAASAQPTASFLAATKASSASVTVFVFVSVSGNEECSLYQT